MDFFFILENSKYTLRTTKSILTKREVQFTAGVMSENYMERASVGGDAGSRGKALSLGQSARKMQVESAKLKQHGHKLHGKVLVSALGDCGPQILIFL